MDTWTRLRQSTRAAHEGIERLPLVARLFADDFGRDELAALFGRLLALHRGLEPGLTAGPEAAAFGYRPRTPLLAADLARLGGSEPPPPPVLPAYGTPAARLGGLYVIEGSILGGQVIRRHLIAHFGDGIDDCLRFYRPYGDEVGAQWQRFRRILEAIAATQSGQAEAEAAALATFAVFSAVLA